ncbi:hypothetical protein RJ640_002957 [Escallonia rubra]|uniref:Nucleolar protein 58 n=1 Tax=Escallonia rubra TaxID=112253 RepID=A0AA88QZ53_9ASTE|nr:hypothetical protein RJ640_002957 [Escallonia rubra]
MGDSKEKATPMEPNLKLKKDKGKPLKDARKFRQLVGSLIYLTITRPEISYSVSVVSQFMQNPRTPHLEAARRILRYVKGTLDYGLLYKRCDNFVLSGFTDADWAGDTNDRHSTSGYCFNTGSAAVSWCSKKQNIVVLSSTEAEYVAATMATQECVWLKRLIGDMFCEVDYAVQIKCDNESAIKLASNPIFHARTKHIEVRYHFVREKVLSEDVELLSVRTNDQVADIFTKALVEPKFQRFRDALGVVVALKAFSKFENTLEALAESTLLTDSKPSKGLRKFLKAHCKGETLAVADTKLGKAIKDKLIDNALQKIECVHNNVVMELMRGVRSHLTELISGLGPQDLAPMSLGLSHSMSRYKLKFSADKVDVIIIQAIAKMDEVDKELFFFGTNSSMRLKELNNSSMRLREWYGWHFPELAKIVQENTVYAKTVKLMGDRTNSIKLDFSEILSEELETELKEAAVSSMGTEVSESDLQIISELCDQVITLADCRAQLYDCLKNRMNAITPNLTALVGELVGARLIAHAGSLLNLSKQPGSTIQILGAEKALFRAMKQKHATPKYGLIYHASLVGQASTKHKGKISRSLAAKTALAIRCDALGGDQDNSMGLENRVKLESRLRNLEGRELGRSAGSAKGKSNMELYNKDRKKGEGMLISPAKSYNPTADSVIGWKESAAAKKEEHMALIKAPVIDLPNEGRNVKVRKEEKKKKHAAEDEGQFQREGQNVEVKKKRRKHADPGETEDVGKKRENKKLSSA